MAASEATTIDAGGRDLRVSNPSRVIFPATEHTREVTKLEIVEYYVAVEDGIMRALRSRPTTLERWPKGVHPGIVVSTREKGGGDAFFQKRVPMGAPDYVADRPHPVPLRPPRGRDLPGRDRRRRLVRADGHDHLPPVAGPQRRRRPSRRAAHRPRPPAGDRLRGRRPRRRRGAQLLGDLGYAGFPKTSGGRGVHIYVRIEPRWTFTDVRHAAIAFGRELERRLPGEVTTKWWKEERGESVFVDYNQNARDRTIASAYSIRPKPGAPVSAPLDWDELPHVKPEDFTVATMPARFAEVGDRHAQIDDTAHSLQPLLDMYEAEGATDMPYPPDYPKMPGEPKRVQPAVLHAKTGAAGHGSGATCEVALEPRGRDGVAEDAFQHLAPEGLVAGRPVEHIGMEEPGGDRVDPQCRFRHRRLAHYHIAGIVSQRPHRTGVELETQHVFESVQLIAAPREPFHDFRFSERGELEAQRFLSIREIPLQLIEECRGRHPIEAQAHHLVEGRSGLGEDTGTAVALVGDEAIGGQASGGRADPFEDQPGFSAFDSLGQGCSCEHVTHPA